MSAGRTHRPKHNPMLCETCGGCTWQCPATIFKSLRLEKDSLRGALYQAREYPNVVDDKPPCIMACPLGQDVPGYIRAVAAKEFEKAADIIRETNALPSVCGRLCIAPCARACTREGIDQGVDIRGIKRAAVEIAGKVQIRQRSVGVYNVAVVGSGPAGLAAAHRLIQHKVNAVVFDANKSPGGALTDYVPQFVLPKEMIGGDIVSLIESGIDIRIGIKIGEDLPWSKLEDDFDAVLVATGAGRGVNFNMLGSTLKGATTAIDFCRVARENLKNIVGEVIVSGGSVAALQAARLAARRGAKKITVIHPVPREQWPAGERDCSFAEEEGIRLMDLHRVIGLSGANEELKEVRIKSVKAVHPDDVDRHRLNNYGKEVRIDASIFISTQDRRPISGAHPDFDHMAVGPIGNLIVDDSYRLGRSKWYAAGEAITGAATIIDSMGTGRAAADNIVKDLIHGDGQ